MKRQDINLLPILYPPVPEIFLPLPRLGRWLLIWTGFLLCIALLQWGLTEYTQTTLRTIQSARSLYLEQIDRLKQQVPHLADQELEQKVALLSEELNQRSRLIHLLGQEQQQNVAGYSGYLQAMAETVPRGLWLSAFQLGDLGIRLEGTAEKAALIPQFAAALQKTASFSDVHFKKVDVNRSVQKDGSFHFILETEEREDSQ